MNYEIEQEIRKLSRISNWHGFCLFLVILCVIGSILNVLYMIGWFNNFINWQNYMKWKKAFKILYDVTIVIGISTGITHLILSIIILVTDWKNMWCKEHKILWGLLSILLLPILSIFIFCSKGKRYLQDEGIETENNFNQQYKTKNNRVNNEQLRSVKKMRSANITAIIFLILNIIHWILCIISMNVRLPEIIAYVFNIMHLVKLIDVIFQWFMTLSTFVCSIVILATKWKSEYASHAKTKMGALALVASICGFVLPSLNWLGILLAFFNYSIISVMEIVLSIFLILSAIIISRFCKKTIIDILNSKQQEQQEYFPNYNQQYHPYSYEKFPNQQPFYGNNNQYPQPPVNNNMYDNKGYYNNPNNTWNNPYQKIDNNFDNKK